MRIIAIAIALLLYSVAFAENRTEIPGYIVYHNAVTTDFFSQDIARQYRLIRSKNRGMINISVLRTKGEKVPKAVPAQINATMTNLLGQNRSLILREIREGNAIYYIGDFLIHDNDRLNFHLDIKPEGETLYYPAVFSQNFYIN